MQLLDMLLLPVLLLSHCVHTLSNLTDSHELDAELSNDAKSHITHWTALCFFATWLLLDMAAL
ncbi:hypothetical protein [Bosea sp. (in: a-proteobacteria)]|uniref:hypothetical protein n=1 Tax=Bosea sp. (in: a-proteobacteria) TaxID=1871050 RepID=UPI0040340B7D